MESNFKRVVLKLTSETLDLIGLRIDKALASVPEIASRSQAARLLQAGRVRIGGRKLKPSYLTQVGDSIDIDIPEAELTSKLEPYKFALQIPYEDDDLLIVDKPAGLVVHPAYGHAQDTLVNALIHHTSDLSLGFNEMRPGLVHRIDKDTSGLLVIAKNDHAQRFLAMQFQRKTTHRLYRAFAYGKFKNDSGIIRSHLKRHADDRKRVTSVPTPASGVVLGPGDGKPAVTHYRVTGYHPTGISLVELRLETGRTHQIRVHLSELGHPIVGDNTYGAAGRVKGLKSVLLRTQIEGMSRFALHAMELGFVHPTSGKKMIFRAPWPSDLQMIIDHCEFPLLNRDYEIEQSDPGVTS